jgi:hypothetical protein
MAKSAYETEAKKASWRRWRKQWLAKKWRNINGLANAVASNHQYGAGIIWRQWRGGRKWLSSRKSFNIQRKPKANGNGGGINGNIHQYGIINGISAAIMKISKAAAAMAAAVNVNVFNNGYSESYLAIVM